MFDFEQQQSLLGLEQTSQARGCDFSEANFYDQITKARRELFNQFCLYRFCRVFYLLNTQNVTFVTIVSSH